MGNCAVELHLDLLMGIDLELRSMALDPLQTAMEKQAVGWFKCIYISIWS